ncbi:MAG: hypothetical protein M1819_007221 [Sarea resinae]|nr:MAG: hypothetical protein M1819_007221 [Sarea resinae]
MEENGRQREQNEASGYGAARHSMSGSMGRFREQPGMSRSRDGSAQGYGYGYAGGPQYGAPLAGSSMQYPADYASDGHRQQQHLSQYGGSNMIYNAAAAAAAAQQQQQAPQQSPYDTVQPYHPRHSAAALEVLSTQFGVPQYFVQPGEATSAAGPALPSQQSAASSQYPPLSYPPQNNSSGRSSFGQSYASSGMPDLSQNSAPEALEQQDLGGQGTSNYDEAYNQYQGALKQTFENTRYGRLDEAGQSLLQISEWLLGHAEDLGLVRDEAELHSDRLRLWNEFNTCWLAVLQMQKDMTKEMLNTGQAPSPPRSILPVEFLEKMGRELVKLCDPMETHGLVDYQMGVWEEEIIAVLQDCLDLLEASGGGSSGGARQTDAAAPRHGGR